jgi:murein DD-endopeptidase MepM/ murein hydrolase activator NlpD
MIRRPATFVFLEGALIMKYATGTSLRSLHAAVAAALWIAIPVLAVAGPAAAAPPEQTASILRQQAAGLEPRTSVAPWAPLRSGPAIQEGTAAFSWPLLWTLDHPRLRITNYPDEEPSFGITDYMGLDFSYEGHQGTDININSFRDMDEGVPVLAAKSGRVLYASDPFYDREISAPNLPWNAVWILHEDGTESGYGHLRKNSVTVANGEYVRAGQMIGLVGSSGFTMMPHLHFEVWRLICGTTYCQNANWIDPWSGTHNAAPSLWASQADYVGDDHLRVYDLAVSTSAAFSEVDRGASLSAFKERPTQPAVVGASESFLAVWTLVSGQLPDLYSLEVHRPDGTLYAHSDRSIEPIDRAWGQGWHSWAVAFALNGTIPPSEYGTWYADLRAGGAVVSVDSFTVGEATQYPPRFLPIAGKSFHLSNETQRDTLSVSKLGPALQDLSLALENAPSNVSLTRDGAGRAIVSIGPAQQDLAAVRSREFAVVATDPAGLQDRMHYHLVNYAASTLGSPPLVTAPSSASVFEGDTITLDVSATDADGDAIASLSGNLSMIPSGDQPTFVAGPGNTAGTLTWQTHAGDAGEYPIPFTATTSLGGGGALSGFGFSPIVQRGSATTSVRVLRRLAARAFVSGGDKVIRLTSGKPTWCMNLEPVDGAFDALDIDPSSVLLLSQGTGSVDRISPILGKTMTVEDRDHDSVNDVDFCFRKEDLRSLLSEISGRASVPVTIEGDLRGGAKFSAVLSLDVVTSGGGSRSASVSPNPLNPEALLTLSIARPGPLRVVVYDMQGRQVRALLDSRYVPAGTLHLRLDARDDRGKPLGSGVYFFQAVSAAGATSGRFVILK